MTTIRISKDAETTVDHAQFLSVTQTEIVWIECAGLDAEEVKELLASQADDSVDAGEGVTEYWGDAESGDPEVPGKREWRIHVRETDHA